MHPKVLQAFEEIDADVSNGDSIANNVELARLYISRWLERMPELRAPDSVSDDRCQKHAHLSWGRQTWTGQAWGRCVHCDLARDEAANPHIFSDAPCPNEARPKNESELRSEVRSLPRFKLEELFLGLLEKQRSETASARSHVDDDLREEWERQYQRAVETLREAVTSLLWTIKKDMVWPDLQPYQALIKSAVAKGEAALKATPTGSTVDVEPNHERYARQRGED